MTGIKRNFRPGQEGAFGGLSFEEYQRAPGLNFSKLKTIGVCPALYQKQPKVEQTAAMRFGTLCHAAALERETAQYHVRPATYGPENKPWRGNATACKEWMRGHQDRPILTEAEDDEVHAICNGLWRHPLAWPLISGGRREVSIFAEYGGRMMKGRADIVQDGYIVDFKTVQNASDEGLQRSVIRFGWHAQLALYHKLANLVGINCERVYLLAVQRGPIPLFNVKRLSPQTLEEGQRVIDKYLLTLDRCESTGKWPDYSGEIISDLNLPAWATTQDVDDVVLTIGGKTVSM